MCVLQSMCPVLGSTALLHPMLCAFVVYSNAHKPKRFEIGRLLPQKGNCKLKKCKINNIILSWTWKRYIGEMKTRMLIAKKQNILAESKTPHHMSTLSLEKRRENNAKYMHLQQQQNGNPFGLGLKCFCCCCFNTITAFSKFCCQIVRGQIWFSIQYG